MQSALDAVPAVIFIAVAAAALLGALGVLVRSTPPEEFARRIFKPSDLDGIRPYFGGSPLEAALRLLVIAVLFVVGASIVSLAMVMLGRWLVPGIAFH
jgi:hypothetical protein